MSDVQSKLGELANRVEKEVHELAEEGESWTVSQSPRISITMQDPRGPEHGGRGHQITPENCSDIKGVMELVRARFRQEAAELDQYVKDMTKKCG